MYTLLCEGEDAMYLGELPVLRQDSICWTQRLARRARVLRLTPMPTQSLDSTRCSVTCMYRVLAACLPLWLAGCATQGNSGGSGPTGTERPDSGISDNSGPVLDVEGDAAVEPTCADVAITKSYLGCEFWPTVTLNPVWSVFDFATVVANTG